jgi:putative endonuclease
VDFRNASRKDVGQRGEDAATLYLKDNGFRIIARNVFYKTGELDIVATKSGVLHAVEVKALLCQDFPRAERADGYDPSMNLHAIKLQKVARTAEWYAAAKDWEGELQVDGILVWIRSGDGEARVEYLPQVF